MSFLKNIFKSDKKLVVKNNTGFWDWFIHNEKQFHNAVSTGRNIESTFFDPLSHELEKLREGFYFVAGMFDDQTAELIFTADGRIKNFIFIEELVAQAPAIPGWKFTAHKPALDINDVKIKMSGHTFGSENMWFYSNEHEGYPDEIDVTIVHKDWTEPNKELIANGCYIFLDNVLGELNFASIIDTITFGGKAEAKKELVPIEKLSAFLNWRQKEFIEKYEAVRHNTSNDTYSIMEARIENDLPLIATLNTELLQWDAKASHPWITTIEIKYDGSQNNGMPPKALFPLLDEIEDDLIEQLKDSEGYLNIGRQTCNGAREFYFACKEFRKPSLVATELIKKYLGKADINYDIYKDKYWMSMNRFMKPEAE